MKQRKNIVLGAVVVLLAACWLAWRLVPVRFLQDVDPAGVVEMQVVNGLTGDEFSVTDPEDISRILTGIQQITFRKKEIISTIDPWYHLTLLNDSGEAVGVLELQNPSCVRKNVTPKRAIFFYCHGELNEVGEELEGLGAVLLSDFDRDPEFREVPGGRAEQGR